LCIHNSHHTMISLCVLILFTKSES
jgi:hypothetical protein